MPPKVSVIVPNYNHAPYLKERIDSILNQTYQDFELILLDDCSTDNSRDILLSYKDNPHVTQIVFNETNSGSPFAQWNKGIELAKGEWIWIAESDDWADLDFLEVMMREVTQYPSVGLAYAKARYMHEGKEIWQVSRTQLSTFYKGVNFITSKLLYGDVIYNVSMTLFKRASFMSINHSLYNKMRLCGDWWFYTLIAEKADVLDVDRSLTYYRVHNTNTSSHAEHEGRTFIEGLSIIEYIVRNYHVSSCRYSRHWGRELGKYAKKYAFSKETIYQIQEILKKKFPSILLWSYIYKFRRKL